MGVYGPEEYFKNLYPEWFAETNLSEIIFLVLLFTILMLVFGYYIQNFQKRKFKIGDELSCGKLNRDHNYNIKIVKVSNDEWLAIKINMDTMERTMLRRGDLSKVVNYINRNFDLKFKNEYIYNL